MSPQPAIQVRVLCPVSSGPSSDSTEEPSQAFKNSRVAATVSGAYWKIAP
jgi:hypothetical protein